MRFWRVLLILRLDINCENIVKINPTYLTNRKPVLYCVF